MARPNSRAPFRAGQTVRVRAASEIAGTLDPEGKLDGMPFMPEMAALCGREFKVLRNVFKTCVEGHRYRRLEEVVILEDGRCDGGAHGGCQRRCHFFWKHAWLEPADAPRKAVEDPGADWTAAYPTLVGDRYVCQSTELLTATKPLSKWDLRHLLQEFSIGELSFRKLVYIIFTVGMNNLLWRLGRKPLRAVVGTRENMVRGDLDLAPGELVEVRSMDEILMTLDENGKNFGLSFGQDMRDFEGLRFFVELRIQRFINEQTGKMIRMEHTVLLRNNYCTGPCSWNCPRNNPYYWRESWLKRVPDPTKQPAGTCG